MSFLPREFFQRGVLTCSRELVGCELSWGECAGVIVETEAYGVQGDEACHTFFRPSTREFVDHHVAGTAYVYLNYGVHWMLNVLVKGGEQDGIILIRALEPLRGIPLMQERRGQKGLHALCSGPGKLTQALGITGTDHGIDLCGGRVGFKARRDRIEVITDVRIGINRAVHLPWRYLKKDSPFVSVQPKGLGGGNGTPVGAEKDAGGVRGYREVRASRAARRSWIPPKAGPKQEAWGAGMG